MKIFTILLTAVISLNAYASDDYMCKITGAFRVNSEGKQNHDGLKSLIGENFSVNRASGLMLGALTNSFAAGPMVVDPGSEESSFRVVNSMLNPVYDGHITNSLTIHEFVDGKSKPFVFLGTEVEVYYGTCVHVLLDKVVK